MNEFSLLSSGIIVLKEQEEASKEETQHRGVLLLKLHFKKRKKSLSYFNVLNGSLFRNVSHGFITCWFLHLLGNANMHDVFFNNLFWEETQTTGERVYLIGSADNTATRPPLLLLSLSFVVLAANGLAHKAGHCWPRCHGNQERLSAVSRVV